MDWRPACLFQIPDLGFRLENEVEKNRVDPVRGVKAHARGNRGITPLILNLYTR
jgi:hypothetical protein